MKKIILSGKGGAGKTTVAAQLSRSLARADQGNRVLIVDADAAMTLPLSLGIEQSWDDLQPLGAFTTEKEDGLAVLDEILKSSVKSIEHDGLKFDFAYMGHHQMNSCLCGYNSSLNLFLDLAREYDQYDYVIVDREAGLEHLTRSVYSMKDDYLVLVSWLSPDYLSVIERINDVADVLGSTENRIVVINDILQNVLEETVEAQLAKHRLDAYPYLVMPRIEKKSVSDNNLGDALVQFVEGK